MSEQGQEQLHPAIINLRDYQRQLDMDGCEVGVSRQAVDETLTVTTDLLAALQTIADESIFNQQRFAEDTDTDYFLRCFAAVKKQARAAIARALGEAGE